MGQPLCPPGEHDFHTGNAPCTKCRRTAEEVRIEKGNEVKTVGSTGNHAGKHGDPWSAFKADLPGREGAYRKAKVVDGRTPGECDMAAHTFSPDTGNCTACGVNVNTLIARVSAAAGGSREATDWLRSEADKVIKPDVDYQEPGSFSEGREQKAVVKRGPVAIGADLAVGGDVVAMHEETRSDGSIVRVIDDFKLTHVSIHDGTPGPHVTRRRWTRMDEIAKLYDLRRYPKEDDDALAIRIRTYVAAHPGSQKTPPPMGWTPPPGREWVDEIEGEATECRALPSDMTIEHEP